MKYKERNKESTSGEKITSVGSVNLGMNWVQPTGAALIGTSNNVNKLPIDGEENVTFSHHIHPTWEKPFYAALYSPARGLGVAMRIR